MKRKILSLALIAALVFALSVSAFAVDSPSGEFTTSPTGTIEALPSNVVDEVLDLVKIINDDPELLNAVWEQLGDLPEDKTWGLGIWDAFDYQGTPNAWNVFNVPGIVAGDKVIVMHKDAENGWKVLEAYVGEDGTVYAYFEEGFSPVAILIAEVDNKVESNEPTTTDPVEPVVTSPQTCDLG